MIFTLIKRHHSVYEQTAMCTRPKRFRCHHCCDFFEFRKTACQTSTSRQGENYTRHYASPPRSLSFKMCTNTYRQTQETIRLRKALQPIESGAVRVDVTHMRSRQTSWCAPSVTANAKVRMRATLEIHAFFARLRSPVVAAKTQRSSTECSRQNVQEVKSTD